MTAGEGERAWRYEALRLSGGGRMGLDSFHDVARELEMTAVCPDKEAEQIWTGG